MYKCTLVCMYEYVSVLTIVYMHGVVHMYAGRHVPKYARVLLYLHVYV